MRRSQRAIDILLDTPAVKDPIALVEGGGAGWAYADEDLEELDADAKAIVADGPGERRCALVWLRALQAALEYLIPDP